MSLDINTAKGQISLSQEQRLIEAVEKSYPAFKILQTPKAEASDVDGFLCKNGVLCGVVENKCRDMTLEQLKKFGNEWLVTYEKIAKGANIAKYLRIPFIGYLYLVPDNLALAVVLTDTDGNFLPNIRLERTETKATTNGGKAIRTNAYISMATAKAIPV